MRLFPATVGLMALLPTLPLLKAHASPPPMEVGPSNIETLPYTFAFTSEDHEGLMKWGVMVTPKKGALSPGLLARLLLRDDKTKLATIPLEETREGGSVTYWFEIAPALLAQARFDFSILSGKEETLPSGKTRFMAIPGTREYQFNLRDYVATKTAAKPKEFASPSK